MVTRLVFSALVIWALIDAAISAGQAPTFGIKIYLFMASFAMSMLFVGGVFTVWSIAAGILAKKTKS